MNRELRVHVDLAGEPTPCGRLWTRSHPRESASFEYDARWLARSDAFALDPELPLGPGAFHTSRPLFRCFTDPAPDRWGQTLLRRAERLRAKKELRAARTLGAVDFLLMVDDETRMGALRFSEAADAGSPFLTSGGARVPPLLALAKLLRATSRVAADDESEDDLLLVLAPGTSLGGTRPKASVRATDGRLLIAKFPRKDDDEPVTRWEHVTLRLAARADIRVAKSVLQSVGRKAVLLLERFDRSGDHRIATMSAMTALSAEDGTPRSYLEIAEALRREGADPVRDLHELFRRVVFNILVSNVDDHLRNHAFVRPARARGWTLSPAYDLNPVPTHIRPRIHALAIDSADPSASLEAAISVAGSYRLDTTTAKAIVSDVARAVRAWRSEAKKAGVTPRQIERMESAFEHDDAKLAARL